VTQYARPSSDVSTGGWTSAPLWSKLDDNSDADYVDGPGTGAVFTCACNAITNPLVTAGFTLRFRARRWGDLTIGVGIKHELLEGSTVRMMKTVNLISRLGFTTYEYTPSAAEINAIGNWGNLRHRITEVSLSGDTPSVAWAEFAAPDLAVPAKVTGLSATDGTRAGDSRLTWNSSSGAASYDVYRHTSNNFAAATKIKASNAGTSYIDTGAGVGVGNKRWYWIVPKNSSGDGPQSDPDTGYAMAVPSVPGSFAASDSTTEDGVDCSWAAATGGGTITYKLLRGGVVIYSGITGLSKRDTTGVPGTTYSYSVESSNEAGDSAASTTNNGTRSVAASGSTTAPTGFSASDGAWRDRVRLVLDTYSGENSYAFFRSLTTNFGPTPFAILDVGRGFIPSTVIYDDMNVVPGIVYYYRAVANTDSGSTDPSAYDTGFASARSLRLFQVALKALLDLGFKGTSSVAGLSATPTVEFEALSSVYAPDPTDAGYSDIPAGAKLGLTHSYDGADVDKVDMRDGTLLLSDEAMSVSAGADSAELLLVYANHGSFKPLVFVQDAFVNNPFAIIGGDSPRIEWSKLIAGSFQFCPFDGDGIVYPCFIENCLGALLGGSTRHVLPSAAPTLKIDLLTVDARLVRQHHYLGDLPDAYFCFGRGVAPVSLASVVTANFSSTGAQLTAANPVFTAPAASYRPAYSALVYLYNADPDAALLALCWPLAAPIVFDGTNITLQFDATLGVWTLNGA
jgi:hypothetical protein